LKLKSVLTLFAITVPLLAGAPPTSPVPEPSTILLVGGGLAAAIIMARKKRNAK
jgi:hypothetical protein